MTVHELHCGTLTPPGGAAVWGTPHFTCRCLLVEQGGSLLAVDTGIGIGDIEHPGQRLGHDWIAQVNPLLDPAETLVAQVTALGRDPREITDVVLTHHHRDRVGGLSDMPWVRVHATPDCRRAVVDADSRSRPAQWAHGVVWAEAPCPAAPWRGGASPPTCSPVYRRRSGWSNSRAMRPATPGFWWRGPVEPARTCSISETPSTTTAN
ncbi:MBL fold metallo-hydrolase [Nocardia brevicatena]|uniref:MBL fold metallo-hydrolase n=1 Tax=Nocardia brevicatena TaxID=37327 RepID=UPI0002EA5EAA|nr:MBL fold metallo-hydrolase [Nocardia brevicatena]